MEWGNGLRSGAQSVLMTLIIPRFSVLKILINYRIHQFAGTGYPDGSYGRTGRSSLSVRDPTCRLAWDDFHWWAHSWSFGACVISQGVPSGKRSASVVPLRRCAVSISSFAASLTLSLSSSSSHPAILLGAPL